MPPRTLQTTGSAGWRSIAALCACLFVLPGSAGAEDSNPAAQRGPTAVCPVSREAVRPQDEFWSINSRGTCATSPERAVDDLRYEQYVPGRGWTRRQLADFAIQAPDGNQSKRTVTSFFIVGNYYTHAEAVKTGWYAYHRLVAHGADDVAVRFVIWSWPADPVPGRRLNDAKIKFTRVDPSAYQLARLVDQLDPDVPLTFCGSSFGAGIAGGALQLLAGGRLGPYQLEAVPRPKRQTRLVVLGAAINNDAFLPGRKYGMALSQAERTLVFVNPDDLALRVYHRLFSRRRVVSALGLTGPAGLRRSPHAPRIELAWASPHVGRKHGMMPYWQSPTLVARMRPYLLMQVMPSKQKGTVR
ncbi:MAG TPA: hypothetical protein VG826_01450 [Pirellulales bacterium]|nr:hypothetical protein [Pirellulales bacterium]